MVEWLIVISLILFGLILLVVEIIFVPGTTVVGLVGFVFMVLGMGLSFKYFGGEAGWITVGSTAVGSGVILYYAFKANLWGKFALKSANKGKVNEGEIEKFAIGEEGVAVSALRPVGKAEVMGKMVEVRTMGEYVDSGKRVRIVKISSNQIFVEPIN